MAHVEQRKGHHRRQHSSRNCNVPDEREEAIKSGGSLLVSSTRRRRCCHRRHIKASFRPSELLLHSRKTIGAIPRRKRRSPPEFDQDSKTANFTPAAPAPDVCHACHGCQVVLRKNLSPVASKGMCLDKTDETADFIDPPSSDLQLGLLRDS